MNYQKEKNLNYFVAANSSGRLVDVLRAQLYVDTQLGCVPDNLLHRQ